MFWCHPYKTFSMDQLIIYITLLNCNLLICYLRILYLRLLLFYCAYINLLNFTIINSTLLYIKTHGSVSCGPRKRGARKRSEYIDRNNKVAIFTHLQLRDCLSKWHQIYSGVSLHEGEATFQILTRSLKLFPRYESAKFRKNFFICFFFLFFFFFFFFVISHTLQKSP